MCYEAFRKIIDYMYLDDHQWLLDQAAAEASSSHEMLEIIKLAKLYKLDSLFKACESHFKELMVQNFDPPKANSPLRGPSLGKSQKPKTQSHLPFRSSTTVIRTVMSTSWDWPNKPASAFPPKFNTMY